MDVLIGVVALLAGVALVVGGAETLVDGLLALGSRLRVAPFVLTVVLSGFELENLAAGIAANARGLPGAAAGSVFGGITFLALGVAGAGAVIAPMRSELPRSFLLWTAASPLAVLALGLDGTLSRLDGALLLVWFCVALAGVARAGRHLLERAPGAAASHPVLRLIGGLVVLAGGGALLGDGLRRLVSHAGVSDTVLGNTAIAASVEAEELGRVAVPARRGRSDLALGNVAGTIVHFAAFNAGVIALVKPLHLNHATRVLHLPAAVAATAVLCLALALRSELDRRAGLVLLALYAAYVAAAIAVG